MESKKSSEETAHIKSSTGICDDARNKVEEVIVSLSSISEEKCGIYRGNNRFHDGTESDD